MKCEFCNKEIEGQTFKSRGGNQFCNFSCFESYYLLKIEQLTKSEKSWHDEWYKQREIIARLGCDGCSGIEEQFKKNKLAQEKINKQEHAENILTQDECNCGSHNDSICIVRFHI